MMNHLRRNLCAAGATALAAALVPAAALGQDDFPSRPIHIIVPYTAGTGADVLARVVGNAMSATLGQSVVIDNRAGAGGMIGTNAGAKAAADGYTLTIATPGTLSIIPAMNRKVQYKTDRDFVAIGAIARSAYVVVSANTAEAPRTFGELLSRLKEKGGTYGIPGVGSTTHLAGEVVLRQAGVKATAVPYPGSTQMLTDVVSGQVGFGFNTVGATLPLVKAGKLRALAVTSAERVASLPDVASASESGVTGLNLAGWWGMVAPAGTPPQAVKKLSDALVNALEAPEVRAKMTAMEVEPFALPAVAFGQLIRQEDPLWASLVKENKLSAE